jgi:hypothetical protein
MLAREAGPVPGGLAYRLDETFGRGDLLPRRSVPGRGRGGPMEEASLWTW